MREKGNLAKEAAAASLAVVAVAAVGEVDVFGLDAVGPYDADASVYFVCVEEVSEAALNEQERNDLPLIKVPRDQVLSM